MEDYGQILRARSARRQGNITHVRLNLNHAPFGLICRSGILACAKFLKMSFGRPFIHCDLLSGHSANVLERMQHKKTLKKYKNKLQKHFNLIKGSSCN